jgi:hypothetical protein
MLLHSLGVSLQILLRDCVIGALEMDQHLKTGGVAKTNHWVIGGCKGCEENSGDGLDELVAQGIVHIVVRSVPGRLCLVAVVALRDLGLRGVGVR